MNAESKRRDRVVYRLNPYFFLSDRRVWVVASITLVAVGLGVCGNALGLNAAYALDRPQRALLLLSAGSLFGAVVLVWFLQPWLHLFTHTREVLTRRQGEEWAVRLLPDSLASSPRGRRAREGGAGWAHLYDLSQFNPATIAEGLMNERWEEEALQAEIVQIQDATERAFEALLVRVTQLVGREASRSRLPSIEVVATDEACSPYSYQTLSGYRVVLPLGQGAPMLDEQVVSSGEYWTYVLAHEFSHILGEGGGTWFTDARLVALAQAAQAILASLAAHLTVLAVVKWSFEWLGGIGTPRLGWAVWASPMVLASVVSGALGAPVVWRRFASHPLRRLAIGGAAGLGLAGISVLAYLAGLTGTGTPAWAQGDWGALWMLAVTVWSLARVCESIGRRQMEYIADETAVGALGLLLERRRFQMAQDFLKEECVRQETPLSDLAGSAAILVTALDQDEREAQDRALDEILKANSAGRRAADWRSALQEWRWKHRLWFGPRGVWPRARLVGAEVLGALDDLLDRVEDAQPAPAFGLGAHSTPLPVDSGTARVGAALEPRRLLFDWWWKVAGFLRAHPPILDRAQANRDPDLRVRVGFTLPMVCISAAVLLIPYLLLQATLGEVGAGWEMLSGPAQKSIELVLLFCGALVLLIARRPAALESGADNLNQRIGQEFLWLIVVLAIGTGLSAGLIALHTGGLSLYTNIYIPAFGLPRLRPVGATLSLTGICSGLYLLIRYTFLASWHYYSGLDLRRRLTSYALNSMKTTVLFGLALVVVAVAYEVADGVMGLAHADWLVALIAERPVAVPYALWAGAGSLLLGLSWALIIHSAPSLPAEVRCPEGHTVPLRWHDILSGRDAAGDWAWLRCPACQRPPQERGPLISDLRNRPEVKPAHVVWVALFGAYGIGQIVLFWSAVENLHLRQQTHAWCGVWSDQRAEGASDPRFADCRDGSLDDTIPVPPERSSRSQWEPLLQTGVESGRLKEAGRYIDAVDALLTEKGESTLVAPSWDCGAWLGALRNELAWVEACARGPSEALGGPMSQSCGQIWAFTDEQTPDRIARLRALSHLYRRSHVLLHGPVGATCREATTTTERTAYRRWHYYLEHQLTPRLYIAVARDLDPGYYLDEDGSGTLLGTRSVPELSERCMGLMGDIHRGQTPTSRDDPAWQCVEPIWDTGQSLEECLSEHRPDIVAAREEALSCLDEEGLAWFAGRADAALAVVESLGGGAEVYERDKPQLHAVTIAPQVRSAQAIQRTIEEIISALEWSADECTQAPEGERIEPATLEKMDVLLTDLYNGLLYEDLLSPESASWLRDTEQDVICEGDRAELDPLDRWYVELACSGGAGSPLPKCPDELRAASAAGRQLCQREGVRSEEACAALLAAPDECAEDAMNLARTALREALFVGPYRPHPLPQDDAELELAKSQRQDRALALRTRMTCDPQRWEALDVEASLKVQLLCLQYHAQSTQNLDGLGWEGVAASPELGPLSLRLLRIIEEGVFEARERGGFHDQLLSFIDSDVLSLAEEAWRHYYPDPHSCLSASEKRLWMGRFRGLEFNSAALSTRPLRHTFFQDFRGLRDCQHLEVERQRVEQCAVAVDRAFRWWEPYARACLSDDGGEREDEASGAQDQLAMVLLKASLAEASGSPDTLLDALDAGSASIEDCDARQAMMNSLVRLSPAPPGELPTTPAANDGLMTGLNANPIDRQLDEDEVRAWWTEARLSFPEFLGATFPGLGPTWVEPWH